ncbi:hypothetical protein NPN19_23830, partial [Vibrio parahaemolyticus]|uniref:hypothetical protein n=1 Tax=Vibrio parahaemolyticus TaxID=670 RepID=UPI0021119CBC
RVLVGDGDNLVEKNVDIERAALAAKEEFAEIKIAENAGASEFVGDRVVIAALQCVAVAANVASLDTGSGVGRGGSEGQKGSEDGSGKHFDWF